MLTATLKFFLPYHLMGIPFVPRWINLPLRTGSDPYDLPGRLLRFPSLCLPYINEIGWEAAKADEKQEMLAIFQKRWKKFFCV